LLCDLLVTTTKIGLPTEGPVITSPDDPNMKILTPENVYQDVSKGIRLLGAYAVRDTMSFLRVLGEIGIINTLETGLEVLTQIVLALKNENEQFSSRSSSKENMLQTYGARILHLNIWLTACIIFDFLTVPILQGYHREDISTPTKANALVGRANKFSDDIGYSGIL